MTTRRLAQLEGAAGPRAVILRWLAQAHAFPTLPHYVEGLFGEPAETWPFALLPGQAAARVRRAMRGAREIDILRAAREAATETLFRLELVLLLNATIDDHQREAALRCQLRVAEMRALAHEQDTHDESESTEIEGGTVAEHEKAWRSAVSAQARDLACAEEARRLLERRYLDSRSALFPRLADQWAVTLDVSSEIARLSAEVLGQAEPSADAGAAIANAMAEASHLADKARSAALGLLGDSRGARAVAARWLRTARADAVRAQR